MLKIDEGFDEIIKCNYELYSVKLFELKELAKSWYKDINFNDFDNRFIGDNDSNKLIQMKKTGILCNYFFAYKEDNIYHLLDGFNRLFTDYGHINVDTTVYLKVLVGELKDNHLMSIMFMLNTWKLQTQGVHSFRITNFLDRGFRLFLYSKFDIKLYDYTNIDYYDRIRNDKDIDVLEKYFIREREYSDMFKYELDDLAILFYNKNIINDFKEIIKSNDYLTEPFNNYNKFLYGFIMWISHKRIKGDNSEYKFQTYLNKLYQDKKFFKKLQGMSGTDSTRKNIYKFFRNL